MKSVIILFFALGTLTVIISMFKSKHFLKHLSATAFQGIASLLAINVTGLITGVTISINWYTIATVCIFGMPSSIALLIADILLR